ncbi:MAG: hypothetical protein HY560_06150 [Gemmatimonadetes bacterium]|nr:hypothetical protein [Gemmatimonadota bacterium]
MVANRGKGRTAAGRVVPWVIAAFGGLALAALFLTRPSRGPSHPEPRPEAATMGEAVMPASFFADNPRVLRAYQMARQIPGTLDGLYCNCHCKEAHGHRSLLTCFQSQHGAGCDVCLGETELAYQMAAQGRNLQDIRQQIDLAFQR